MTDEEFDNINFTGGMEVEYKGIIYHAASCNLKERTFGLSFDLNNLIPLMWVEARYVYLGEP